MSTFVVTLFLFVVIFANTLTLGCLITNCPRGGKRSGKFGLLEGHVKPCVSCGPGHSGQCFGPNICCGPFGCLLGTPETYRCQRDGFFQEPEPCIAGNNSCRKNTGRCATEGICCNQEACFSDRTCTLEEKHILTDNIGPLDLYNFLNYQNEIPNEK